MLWRHLSFPTSQHERSLSFYAFLATEPDVLSTHIWIMKLREGLLAVQAEREIALALRCSRDPKTEASPTIQMWHNISGLGRYRTACLPVFTGTLYL